MATKRRGPKNKGRGKGSDYKRGYFCGWKRVEIGVRRGIVKIDKQSKAYREGYRAGMKAAKRYYKSR